MKSLKWAFMKKNKRGNYYLDLDYQNFFWAK
ncbi:hypothetical protein P872_25095 [Rhodonellum psychrophilum GCM71 = DSM 17998]|uniref:Uncharacterized protein n=1 Tax=Rhodonellum psychrophilum GCM71 = DSM 17998 TaxID=1123057 RepID=U5BUX3_9BACT|nr:hypothetical protein P872_25095 [Rhodonellum psychrophilum GCM71 = DSM 17998]